MSAGAIIVGGVVSTTATICVAVAKFPVASVAVHVTMVSPTGNTEGASFVTEETPTRSATTGWPMKIIFSTGSTASKRMSLGGIIDGAAVSTTVIV